MRVVGVRVPVPDLARGYFIWDGPPEERFQVRWLRDEERDLAWERYGTHTER